MWRNSFSRRLVLLSLSMLLASVIAARPRVSFAASVNVPPYTDRWRAAGLLGEVERLVVEAARPHLSAFQFLEWEPGSADGAQMLLSIEEDQSSRPAGARPWVLEIRLTTRDVARSERIRVARASEAHALSRDVATSKGQFIDLVKRAFAELTVEATAKMFVTRILSNVPVADDIDQFDQHALITVPYLDLHATPRTVLNAQFKQSRSPMTINLRLIPANGVDIRTECTVSAEAALQSPSVWGPYVKARTKPIWISMAEYVPDLRSLDVRDKMGADE